MSDQPAPVLKNEELFAALQANIDGNAILHNGYVEAHTRSYNEIIVGVSAMLAGLVIALYYAVQIADKADFIFVCLAFVALACCVWLVAYAKYFSYMAIKAKLREYEHRVASARSRKAAASYCDPRWSYTLTQVLETQQQADDHDRKANNFMGMHNAFVDQAEDRIGWLQYLFVVFVLAGVLVVCSVRIDTQKPHRTSSGATLRIASAIIPPSVVPNLDDPS